MGNAGEEVAQPLLRALSSPRKERHVIKYLAMQESLERVAIRGVQTVLALFLLESLHISEVVSTELVHFFLFGAFVSPILGSFISGALKLGNYRSIYLFSMCELIGLALLAIAAIPNERWHTSLVSYAMTPVALALVVLGSGGLKPCQVIFGGDQMCESGRHDNSRKFFSGYFFAMKLGELFSAVVYPVIRTHRSYFLTFVMSALSMFLCIGVFWMGRKEYIHKSSAEPRFPEPPSETSDASGHYLQPADSRANEHSQLLEVKGRVEQEEKISTRDPKAGALVLLILATNVFLSMLAFQTNSTWVFQGRSMDGRVPWMGSLRIQPDQMASLLPLAALIFIPLLDSVIPPQVGPQPKLARMVVGMALAALSFVAGCALQLIIDARLEGNMDGQDGIGQTDISIFWQVPQYVLISLADLLFFMTGTNFAYEEAPLSMKSAIISTIYINAGLGNILTIATIGVLEDYKVSTPFQFFTFASIGAFGTLWSSS